MNTSSVPEHAPRERSGISTPVLTYFMCASCIVLTLAHHVSERAGFPESSFLYRFGHFGHLPASQIWGGQWPALFTTLFIHGDPNQSIWITIAHIGFNLMVLVQAGRVLEATLNPIGYYVFFVAAAMVGSGAELAVSGSTGVGASGVVYAMFGLLWAGRDRDEDWAEVANPQAVRIVVGWAVFCVALTQFGIMRIANAAHFGGLFFGIAVGWVFFVRKRRLIGAAGLIALATLVGLSLTWMPWSPYWAFWKGIQERRERHYDRALSWLYRSRDLGLDRRQVDPVIWQTTMLRDHPEVFGYPDVPEEPDRHFIRPRPGLVWPVGPPNTSRDE